MDCLFCKIVNKELPAYIIDEDESAVAVLDVNPRAPGHSMVLTRRHAENILDLPDGEFAEVFKFVKKTTGLIQEALKPDGFTIGINHGRVSGQTIDHLHIHILPRWHTDAGGSMHSVVHNPPKESLDEMRERILRFKRTNNK